MRLRMKESKSGSPNGLHIFLYQQGQEYDESTSPRLPAKLAEVFLIEGWAEEVADEAASFPAASAPAPVAAPADAAVPAAPVADPTPEAAPAPEVERAPEAASVPVDASATPAAEPPADPNPLAPEPPAKSKKNAPAGDEPASSAESAS